MDTRRRCQLCTSTTTNMACYYVSPTCRPESVKRAIATEFLRLLVQPSPLTLSINTFTTTSSGAWRPTWREDCKAERVYVNMGSEHGNSIDGQQFRARLCAVVGGSI